VLPEGLCQRKIPMTPSGIEPATFQTVIVAGKVKASGIVSYMFFKNFVHLKFEIF
jgi:hypothetical protein